jgi:hypothetical protein
MLPPKDVEEWVVVTFNFQPLLTRLGLSDTSLSDVNVETGRDEGDGQLVADGAQQVSGVKVRQLYKAGTRGQIYDVACLATLSNGERRRLWDRLPVA